MRPVVERVAQRRRHRIRPGGKLFPVRRITSAQPLSDAVGPHGAPFVVITIQPNFRERSEAIVLGDQIRPQVAVVVDNGKRRGHFVVEAPRRFRFEEEILVDEDRRWLNPLAKKPPSTARISPFTKLADSDARKTPAPTSSSTLRKRSIGMRSFSSLPRSLPPSRAVLGFVRNTPGAIG